MFALLYLLIVLSPSLANRVETYSESVHRFDYDSSRPLNMQQIGVEHQNGVDIYDITYAGLTNSVPAYLVVPRGAGPFPAILWGHWMMEGSPYKNRKEFLREAILLARSGVVSLLIDAPMVRPGYKQQDEPFDIRDDVIDLRRGFDLLAARRDVDRARIAYVGHSFHAAVGAILAGVDNRFKAVVLMAGSFDYEQTLVSAAPKNVELRHKVPVETLRKVYEEYSWSNPCRYAGHVPPTPVLLQDGTHDQFMTLADIEHYNDCFSSPRDTKLYQAGHALNSLATKDRDTWLQIRLGFEPVAPNAWSQWPLLK